MKENIIVLGGDGFCGWPTSLYLSKSGYCITIVDNLSRRNIDNELGCESLTPISHIEKRISKWQELTGEVIEFVNIDVSKNYQRLLDLFYEKKPKAVVHFAEQRAAPYSMKSPSHKMYTVNNNLNATHNVLCAIVESQLDIALVHLGTMGVYGYGTAGMEIPEGYLDVKVEVNGEDHDLKILYPANPGSIYHMTKTQDALFFQFYAKNDGLKITDLHQGIVWGTNTEETSLDEVLINRYDYDGDYGTVLNRFLMQAAIGHPLTVHGSGGQTRAFIHISDTVKCIKIAIENPPKKGGPVKIFNQATETHTVKVLAEMISDMTEAEIRFFINPRNEAPENDLRVKNESLIDLGLSPRTLDKGLMKEVVEVGRKYVSRCDKSKILAKSKWRSDMIEDEVGSADPIKV